MREQTLNLINKYRLERRSGRNSRCGIQRPAESADPSRVHRVKPITIGLLTLALLLFSTGCSKDLSRWDAETQIETHWVDVHLGEVEVGNAETKPDAIIECGIQKGLWQRDDLGNGHYLDFPARKVEAYIFLVNNLHDSLSTKPTISFRVHPKVTGIREGNTPSISVVDYTWEVDWDGLPQDIKGCLPDPKSMRLRENGTVVFERYDDGWRFKRYLE